MEEDDGSSATLIFYKLSKEWWKEPLLNLLAAAAQGVAFLLSRVCVTDTKEHHCTSFSYPRLCIKLLVAWMLCMCRKQLDARRDCHRRNRGTQRRNDKRRQSVQRQSRRGACRPHGKKPTIHLPVAGMFKKIRFQNAQICKGDHQRNLKPPSLVFFLVVLLACRAALHNVYTHTDTCATHVYVCVFLYACHSNAWENPFPTWEWQEVFFGRGKPPPTRSFVPSSLLQF